MYSPDQDVSAAAQSPVPTAAGSTSTSVYFAAQPLPVSRTLLFGTADTASAAAASSSPAAHGPAHSRVPRPPAAPSPQRGRTRLEYISASNIFEDGAARNNRNAQHPCRRCKSVRHTFYPISPLWSLSHSLTACCAVLYCAVLHCCADGSLAGGHQPLARRRRGLVVRSNPQRRRRGGTHGGSVEGSSGEGTGRQQQTFECVGRCTELSTLR